MRDSVRNNTGFASARARENQHRAVDCFDGEPLLGIERVQIHFARGV